MREVRGKRGERGEGHREDANQWGRHEHILYFTAKEDPWIKMPWTSLLSQCSTNLLTCVRT